MKANSLVLVFVLAIVGFITEAPAGDYFTYDGYTYSFHRYDVPDLDQYRSSSADSTIPGLPNNGAMYCVPTSAVNWMAYIANHGYPFIIPGPGHWNVSPPLYLNEYNYITSIIEQM